ENDESRLAAEPASAPGTAANVTIVRSFKTEIATSLNNSVLENATTIESSGVIPGLKFTGTGRVGDGMFVAGGYHTCAIMADGMMKCWGNNREGQVGDGGGGWGSRRRTTPQDVVLPTNITGLSVTAGEMHTCAVFDDGSIRCWGRNNNGQIGDNSTSDRSTPRNVSMPPGLNATAVSAGDDHTCGLMDDGSVWCWGMNDDLQVGTNGTLNNLTPIEVLMSGSLNATAISAGGIHTCALLTNGSVACWGGNEKGQLGFNTSSFTSLPDTSVLPSGRNVTSISAGGSHTCVLLDNGSAACWGDNEQGQLGDGSRESTTEPTYVNISSSRNVTSISAGGDHTCALLDNGTLFCWGDGGDGRLGYGGDVEMMNPMLVNFSIGRIADAVSSGHRHTCAVLDNGSMECWGYNNQGAIGDGTRTSRWTPTSVTNLMQTPGAWVGTPTTLSSGNVLTVWANNSQTGTSHSASINVSVIPGLVYNSTNIVLTQNVNASINTTVNCDWCAFQIEPDLPASLVWNNSDGSFTGNISNLDISFSNFYTVTADGGNGSDETILHISFLSTTPIPPATAVIGFETQFTTALNTSLYENSTDVESLSIPSGLAFTSTGGVLPGTSISDGIISAGAEHTCAVMQDGGLKCWGGNGGGQLGDGTRIDKKLPLNMSLPANRSAVAVAASSAHTCTILDDGSVYCWGTNTDGQVGDGTWTDRLSPTQISLPVGRKGVSIFAGEMHTCAIMDNGGLACWGDNDFGQIGDNTTIDRNTPTRVHLPSNRVVDELSMGAYHTCALLNDSTMHCWGKNDYSQTGSTGSTTPQPSRVQFWTNNTILDIAAGGGHTCALLNDSTVRCWGWNSDGQIGDDSDNDRTSPREAHLPSGSTPLSVVAGYEHTCAILSDGSMRCWGRGNEGQIGDGSQEDREEPRTVNLPRLRTAEMVVAGKYHTCAVLDDGMMRCWGNGVFGQLGLNSTYSYAIAQKPNDLPRLVGDDAGLWTGVPDTLSAPTVTTAWANDTENGASFFASVNFSVLPPIDYGMSILSLPSNNSNISFQPSVHCTWCNFSIDPPLPDALHFNSSTGTIIGRITFPDMAFNNSYVVTAMAPNGTGQIQLQLMFNPSLVLAHVPLVRGFSTSFSTALDAQTRNNATTIEASGAPPGMSFSRDGWSGIPTNLSNGHVLTTWANNTNESSSFWASVNVSVHPALSYPVSNITNVRNGTFSGITPIIVGGPYTISITPPLPNGLTLDSSTGTINGTFSSIHSTTTHTITASNASGSDTFPFDITIDETPPSITASLDFVKLIGGVSMIPVHFPNTGGPVTSWSISPPLPLGLSFSPLTGIISGTPAVLSPLVNHTIIATNSAGSDSVTISLLILIDSDGDGTPDVDDLNDDGDDWLDAEEEECGADPLDADDMPLDTDGDWDCDTIDDDDDDDGVLDVDDDFPLDPDEDTDTDDDGKGNNMDADDDGDTWPDVRELNCGTDPLDSSDVPVDLDGDGMCDVVLSDTDGDGVVDDQDLCEGHDDAVDIDGDGTPDGCDALVDSDSDGVADLDDQCPGHDDSIDIDQDGTPDGCDEAVSTVADGPDDTNATTNLTDNVNNATGSNVSDSDSNATTSEGTLAAASDSGDGSSVNVVIIIVLVIFIGLLGAAGLLLRGGSEESEMVDEMMAAGDAMSEQESEFTQDPGMMNQQVMDQGQEMWSDQPDQAHQAGGWPDRNQIGEYDQEGWEWLEFPPGSGVWYYRDPASGDWWLP
ncbi:MAG: hypothetical protein CL992_00945, partial [Euryarchaeota archaeon]|nr:hypothetical protein [Euryarchaeota archaeon]